jgi:hypothetical protein
MKKLNKLSILTAFILLGSLVLSACGASTPEPTPTISVEAIRTSAVATFSAGLTQTAIAMPTITPTNTPVPILTATPTKTSGAGIPTGTCYWLTMVKDVTIPDNTPMNPGQTFTKTWLVRNTGSCAWEAGFKLAFASGDAMGGTTFVLQKPVSPGAETELSIPMTAPNKDGTGNWRMATTSGTFFGDYVWVIIIVGGTTPTSTGTVTSDTPTPTNTP